MVAHHTKEGQHMGGGAPNRGDIREGEPYGGGSLYESYGGAPCI